MTYEINIASKGSDKKIEELIREIESILFDGGLYALSKNDIYDKLLFLFDKYDDNHFLSTNSNYKNARLLKTTETKIKNAKLNIAQKFYDDTEYNSILFDFVVLIATKPGVITESKKSGSCFDFVIENVVTRKAVEAKLKEITNDTLDYSFNTERVTINKVNFLKLLSFVYTNTENPDKNLAKLIADAKRENGMSEAVKVLNELTGKDIGAIIECTFDVAKSICSFIKKRTINQQ